MLNKTRHATYDINVHLVFVTKYRKKIFDSEMLSILEDIFKELTNKCCSTIVEYNGEVDHVHLLVNIHPTISISSLVNILKGVSSRKLKKLYPELTKIYYGSDIGLWSRAYYVSSVGGVKLEVLKQYIQKQNHPL